MSCYSVVLRRSTDKRKTAISKITSKRVIIMFAKQSLFFVVRLAHICFFFQQNFQNYGKEIFLIAIAGCSINRGLIVRVSDHGQSLRANNLNPLQRMKV